MREGPVKTEETDQKLSPLNDDRVITAIIRDAEASSVLRSADPITWLKGSIAADIERGASEITDEELREVYLHRRQIGDRLTPEESSTIANELGQYLRYKWLIEPLS